MDLDEKAVAIYNEWNRMTPLEGEKGVATKGRQFEFVWRWMAITCRVSLNPEMVFNGDPATLASGIASMMLQIYEHSKATQKAQQESKVTILVDDTYITILPKATAGYVLQQWYKTIHGKEMALEYFTDWTLLNEEGPLAFDLAVNAMAGQKFKTRPPKTRPPSIAEEEANTAAVILKSFDAKDWAKAFVAHVKRKPSIATDEGTMIGWFANALVRGLDEGVKRAEEVRKDAAREIRWRAVLP